MISLVLDQPFHELQNDILDFYKRFILFVGFYFGKNVENFGKTAVFPGGYGRIGEIQHRRIWPDWGL